ncbi:MAG: BON domain-containing protein [Burkholderiaceae bacterium]|nr:MAG: BON domain-containing protein [Burkholderiaceae bacterium]
MKTDYQLKQDVIAELEWDPAINSDAVGIAVKDGVVTASGHIDTYAEKRAIEKALRRVSGLKTLALDLEVKLSPQHQREDTGLAIAIQNALRWNSVVPADKIRVTVDNGRVTLAGNVDWDYQRIAAEKAVRPLTGVTGISNQIGLSPHPAPADVVSGIEGALKRQAERQAKRVQVDVSGSTVTLRGDVRSWPEHTAAEGAAWSAPGVRKVINELRVNP